MRLAAVLPFALALTFASWSQADDPVPRTPPLPGRSFAGDETRTWAATPDLADRAWRYGLSPPRELALALDGSTVSITNYGTSTLAFNIWDPVEGWLTFEVPARTRSSVRCEKCEGKAKVAFHNGKKQIVYSVQLGRTIRADWAGSENVWALSAEAEGVLLEEPPE
jgi:hypothetical protein